MVTDVSTKHNVDYYKDQILKRSQAQNLTLMVNNKAVLLPVRMPNQGEHVIIDYLNFVVGITDLEYQHADNMDTWLTMLETLDADLTLSELDRQAQTQVIIDHISDQIGCNLASIFGDDIDDIFSKLIYTGKGLHRYKYCFDIGSRENTLGKVCFGGQNNTCLIMINGFGCAMACKGWETKLHDFLTDCKKAHITRIDLAHDDFDGAYSSVETADQKESEGYFYISGTKPKVQQLGDWKYNLGDGRTLQIGKRANGKMCRAYEKGRQLGDTDSKWFRVEVELRNQSREIPLDILISPTEYFSGFYPYTAELIDFCVAQKKSEKSTESKATRIPLIVKSAEITLKKSIEIWRKQAGRYIKVYRQLFCDDTAILNMLECKDKKDFYPKRLSILDAFKSSEFASLPGHSPTYAL